MPDVLVQLLSCTAYLWQLMRRNVLQLLENLKFHGSKEISDADIIRWANDKVKSMDKASQMANFKVRQ